MPKTRQPVPAAVTERAEVLRARRDLTELDSLRLVKAALRDGVSQADLAEAMGVSQATVSRMAVKAAARDLGEPTVAEIIDRASAHEIDRADMLRQLRSLRIMYARNDKRPDSSWSALLVARRRRRISRQEARAIAEDVAQRVVGRVTASMDLEAQPVPAPGVAKMVEKVTAKLVADLD